MSPQMTVHGALRDVWRNRRYIRIEWSLIWRIPVCIVLLIVSMACFAADDIYRAIRKACRWLKTHFAG